MAWADEKKRVAVKDAHMAYVERGAGDPIVFLHGNPTSSYLWRNIIPHLEPLGRCLAPDLIGMGDSDKLEPSGPDRYRFVEHREYLDGFLEAVGATENVTLVVHDWGSALGFDWANRHRNTVRGIAYMEALVAPIPVPPEEPFASLRSPAGERMILEENMFVEEILPAMMLGELSEADHAEYRRPYLEQGESRRPTLTWPREIPFEGQPEDVAEIVTAYASWLPESDMPKLLIRGEPGALLAGPALEYCRAWPNQNEITVPGMHYLQEDSPDEIGEAIARWVEGLR